MTYYAWASEATSKRCYKIGDTNTPYVDLDQPAITLGPGVMGNMKQVVCPRGHMINSEPNTVCNDY